MVSVTSFWHNMTCQGCLITRDRIVGHYKGTRLNDRLEPLIKLHTMLQHSQCPRILNVG